MNTHTHMNILYIYIMAIVYIHRYIDIDMSMVIGNYTRSMAFKDWTNLFYKRNFITFYAPFYIHTQYS